MKTSRSNVRIRSKCRDLIAVSAVSLSLVSQPILSSGAVITTDPALAGAIAIQTQQLEKSYKDRKKHREAIEFLQGQITAGLTEIHRVEDMILDYMGNASGVLTNMIQMKNIGEYTVEISNKMVAIIKDIPNNPKGAAITAICHKHVQKTTSDIVSMSDLVTNLVTTKYSLKNVKSEDDKRHVNLLSAAERYNLLVSVEQKLIQINYDLMLLHYFIKTLSWRDLWFGLDRESYLKAIMIGVDVNSIINKWNKISK